MAKRPVNRQVSVEITAPNPKYGNSDARLTLSKWWPGGNATFHIPNVGPWTPLTRLPCSMPPMTDGRMETERRIDPRALPNLTHTKMLDASIEGEATAKPNWNLLLDEVLRRAMKRARSFEKLHQLCPVNMVKGRKEDEGFSYLAEIDISV